MGNAEAVKAVAKVSAGPGKATVGGSHEEGSGTEGATQTAAVLRVGYKVVVLATPEKR
jgi:hypothetical protein